MKDTTLTLSPAPKAAEPVFTAPAAPSIFQSTRFAYGLILLLVLVGVFLRGHHWENIKRLYFDEAYYVKYARHHAEQPLSTFPSYVDEFIKHQAAADAGIPPPTRLIYPLSGALVHKFTGQPIPRSLIMVSAVASMLLLIIAAIWAARMFSPGMAAGITALTAVSLNQLHLSQRIMIDPVLAVFCLAAMWSLWELGNTPRPKAFFWILYFCAMGGVVMVKENSFFIYIGMAALLLFGRVTGILPHQPKYLLAATVAVGALSLGTLMALSGGIEKFIDLYRLLVERSLATPYAIIFGDGPWYRYLVDSILAQPLPTILAIAALFWAPFENARIRYLCVFMVATYAVMSQVKYGMFYRYAIIWDLAIAALAMFQIRKLATTWLPPRRAVPAQVLAVFGVCCLQFGTFWQIGVVSGAYALTTHELITALKMYNPQAETLKAK